MNAVAARLGALLLSLAALPAFATTITREFSASWFDPSHPGHGFSVEVVDNAAGKSVVAYWYTFDAAGAPLWLLAQGPAQGARATLSAVTTSGGRFGNDFGAGQLQVRPWGTLEIEFSDCNHGQVRWFPGDPALAAGSMPIERLTQLYGSACTGGVSDDAQSGTAALASEQFLANTGLAPQARGRTRYAQAGGVARFDVELEDLPAGSYSLRVGGVARASIAVQAIAGGTQGEIEFRSPVEPGKVLLDFDVSGALVEVVRDGAVYLRGTQGQASAPPVPGGAPPTGNAVYAVRVEPQGNNGPQLEVELEQRADRVELKVELEDVAAGSYAIRIAGVERGTLAVVAIPGGTHGELEFRTPVEAGKLPLAFDPRGALIEAVRNGVVTISATLPSQPTGTPGGGGGNDDGGGAGTTSSVALASTGVDGNAHGDASYESSASEREFEVEVEDLDDGDYTLFVASVSRATIAVARGRGEVKFATPARSGRLLLDFDPRGARIEVRRGATVYLAAQFPG